MVSIKTVDRLVGLLVVGILLLGAYSVWLGFQQMTRRMGMMGMMPGMNPVWYLFGTVIAVGVVLGVYALLREQLAEILSTPSTSRDGADGTESGGETGVPDESTDPTEELNLESSTTNSDSAASRALTFLPEDERRVVEPILESPGLTQVELRARSEFSKAKVSQTVGELEDRGLIYREKEGRTYRVYPGELLKEK